MAQYELLLPKMGESVAEATIIKWVKQPGEWIELDDTILEIATDKVDSEVPSPVAGKLVKQLFNEDDVVQVGDVIAILETGNEEGGAESQSDANEQSQASLQNQSDAMGQGQSDSSTKDQSQSIAQNQQQDSGASNGFIQNEMLQPPTIPGIEQLAAEPVQNYDRFYSPLVKNIAAQEGISMSTLQSIPGTGAEGRLTKDDLLKHLANKSSSAGSNAQGQPAGRNEETSSQAAAAPAPKAASVQTTVSVSGGDEIIEMDRMRKLIAEHMVMSKQTSPHVTSFVEADVTNMVLWRERVKKPFEKRENEKITFTPIFIEAVTKAIKDFPMINVSINGTQIIKKKDINIGMAAALPSGNLIVPVIRNADQLNLIGLTKKVNDLANRARISKLKPDETQGGTFTLTNVGSFGNVMGTPIINQPQVAILAVGAIKKKPAVLETEFGDVIAIRHMMFLSLSYDHRVVDGALGGSFVKRVADYLENWDVTREI
jgi:2-oxoglutarate dehydrogenase E2 component (dihydrolipoamide succinyltransferase)